MESKISRCQVNSGPVQDKNNFQQNYIQLMCAQSVLILYSKRKSSQYCRCVFASPNASQIWFAYSNGCSSKRKPIKNVHLIYVFVTFSQFFVSLWSFSLFFFSCSAPEVRFILNSDRINRVINNVCIAVYWV